jgi:hypothetical protein
MKATKSRKFVIPSIPDKDTTKFIDADKPLNLEQILARDNNKNRVKKKRTVSR